MMNFLRSIFSSVPGTSVTFNTGTARKALRSIPAAAGKATTTTFKVTGRVIGGVPDIVGGCASVIRKVAKG